MGVRLVLGLQTGDEGKAKIVDMLAQDADLVVRFQGGANAGHTVVVDDEEYVFHLLPAGALYEGVKLCIGTGVALDLIQLNREVQEFEKRSGLDILNRLFIDARTELLFPYHRILDFAADKKQQIGTTGMGIGPFYTDHPGRRGIPVAALSDRGKLGELVRENCELAEVIIKDYYGVTDFPALFDEVTEKEVGRNKKLLELGLTTVECLNYRRFLKDNSFDHASIAQEVYELGKRYLSRVVDLSVMFNTAVRAGENIILEGAQGSELDINFGSGNSVTSSNTIAGAASVGVGFGPGIIDDVLGVGKAYCTKVGNHTSFVTEIEDGPLRTKLMKVEFGATTGRQRHVGWFDLVQARRYQMINGHTSLAIPKLDLLSGAETLKVCVAYDLNGERLELPPTDKRDMTRVKPIYQEFPGWSEDISEVRRFQDLPQNARKYLLFITDEMRKYATNGLDLTYVGVGADREQTIKVR